MLQVVELQAVSTRGHHSQPYWTSAYTIEVQTEQATFEPLLTSRTRRPRVIFVLFVLPKTTGVGEVEVVTVSSIVVHKHKSEARDLLTQLADSHKACFT